MAGERVAVVGVGLMGHGIAQVFAEAGLPVAVWDPDPVARTSVAERVSANLRATGRARTSSSASRCTARSRTRSATPTW